VVGFDDIFPASLTDPPADHGAPADAQDRRARLRTGSSSGSWTRRCGRKVELLPAELVLRASCGCPSGTVTRHHVATITHRKAGLAG